MFGGRLRRSLGGSATAVRFTAILTAVGCCLAAAAYATTRSLAPGSIAGGEHSPLRPRIIGHPDPVTADAVARFDFRQPGRPPRRARPGPSPRMECRLDDESWEPCVAPVTLTGIDRGGHRFSVRAVNRAGVEGPPAIFGWRRRRAAARTAPSAPAPDEWLRRTPVPRAGSAPVRPQPEPPAVESPPAEEPETPATGPPFALRQIGALGELYPGAPPETIGVLIENPNEEQITVTSVTADIVEAPPECPAMRNFVLTPAAVSPTAAIVVPGESTFSLPAEGIAGPKIAMNNLPVSQDPCEGAELDIALEGEGGG